MSLQELQRPHLSPSKADYTVRASDILLRRALQYSFTVLPIRFSLSFALSLYYKQMQPLYTSYYKLGRNI
jgi:hypothetical protein